MPDIWYFWLFHLHSSFRVFVQNFLPFSSVFHIYIPKLTGGLHVPGKAERVARYHSDTVYALAEMLGAMGLKNTSQVRRQHIYRRNEEGQVETLDHLYPCLEKGALLDSQEVAELGGKWSQLMDQASADRFA